MKELIKSAARKLGFEVIRTKNSPSSDPFIAMRRLVTQKKPVIFDVGANEGQTTLRFRSLFPSAFIHSFEPFPTSFDRMSSLLAGDAFIKPQLLALSDTPGLAKLNVNRSSETNSLLPSDQRASVYWGENLLNTEAEIEVITDTVDNYCDQYGINHISILKLDVQGAEYAVLTGALKMLTSQSVDVIYMEMITAPTYVGQKKLHEYLAFFDSLKYEVFGFYNLVRREGFLIQTDNIMVSSNLAASNLKHNAL